MFRNCVTAMVASMLLATGLVAQEKTIVTGVDGVFKKFDGDKVTFVPDGAKDGKTIKISMETQIEMGKKTMTVPDVMKDWKSGQHGTFFVHHDQLVNAVKTTKGK